MRHLAITLLTMFAIVARAQDSIEVVNIENLAVQAFMADRTYDNEPEYMRTVIEDYYDEELYGSNLDRPAGKLITWTHSVPTTDIEAIRISLFEDGESTKPHIYYTQTIEGSTFMLTNLLPGKTYRYIVTEILKSGELHNVASSIFRTTGKVRMMTVDGARNIRDLGGWQTSFGYPLKYGRLFRSGNLDGVTEEGIEEFKGRQKVSAELDLRAASTLEYSPLGDDVDFVIYGTSQYFYGVTTAYSAYISELKWVVGELRKGKNVDWHCQIGCDRCGTFSFLVEGLLGVSEADLCRDYELSTFSGNIRPRDYYTSSYGGFAEMMAYMKRFGPEDDLAQCFYNYWKDHGMDTDDLDYIRKVMIDTPEEGTGIKDINDYDNNDDDKGIYNLQGMRLEQPMKGINIINGKKILRH